MARPFVLLVSIDGFADFYWRDERVKAPTLRALAERGAVADGVTAVFPSTTWPTHVSLVTGVRPARHGVVANHILNRATRRPPAPVRPARARSLLGDRVHRRVHRTLAGRAAGRRARARRRVRRLRSRLPPRRARHPPERQTAAAGGDARRWGGGLQRRGVLRDESRRRLSLCARLRRRRVALAGRRDREDGRRGGHVAA